MHSPLSALRSPLFFSALRTPLSALGARTARRRGFSLIELLVVMATIAILAGLAFPAISRVRDNAKTSKCLSNLRQWGMAMSMYLDEHRGLFPTCPDSYSKNSATAWYNALPPYLNLPTMDELVDNGNVAYPGGGHDSLMLCPAEVSTVSFDEENEGGLGAQFHASYSMNKHLDNPKRLRLAQLGQYASAFVVMAEGMGGAAPLTLADFTTQNFRHRHGMNVLFADGHAQTLAQDQLWTEGLGADDNYGGYQWDPSNTDLGN